MNTRNIFMLGIILLSVSTSFSQSSRSTIGFEGGASFVTIYGNEYAEDKGSGVFRFSGGFSYQYRVSDLFALRTNVFYERKGNRIYLDDILLSGEPIELTGRNYYDYLTVPLLCRVTFGKKIKFFANAGPYAGVLVSQRIITETNSKNYPGTESNDIDDFVRMDYGISSGVGMNFKLLEDISLGFELRNNLGLRNISNGPVYNDGAIKNNTTSILIGLAFNLKAAKSKDKEK